MAKSQTLNTTTRRMLLDELTTHKFAPEYKRIVETRQALFFAAYNLKYDVKTRKQMDALPKTWLPVMSQVHVRVGYERHDLSLSDTLSFGMPQHLLKQGVPPVWWRLPEGYKPGVRVPYADCMSGHFELRVGEDTKFGQEVTALSRSIEDVRARYSAAYRIGRETIASARTIEALLAVWPEVKPFTDKLIPPESKGTALAVSRPQLNEAFGLPV